MTVDVERVLGAWARSPSEGAEAFDSELTASGASFDAICNAVALALATRFLADEISFSDADAAANGLWARMVQESSVDGSVEIANFAYEVFQAFDEGEYRRKDGSDPIIDHTIPLLRAAVASSQG